MSSPTKLNWAEGIIAGLVLVLLCGALYACNESVYGDWRCLFAQCRLEK